MRKTHTPEQIIDILRQVERETSQGKTVAETGSGSSRTDSCSFAVVTNQERVQTE